MSKSLARTRRAAGAPRARQARAAPAYPSSQRIAVTVARASDGPGLTAIDGRLCWVQPLDSKRMLAFTDRQFERHWDMIFKELGLDKYLEYVAAAYPELLDNVKRKLKKMS